MTTKNSICRFCHAFCGIQVTVEDGRATKVTGDREDPLFQGFTCAKGRATPEQMYHPDRLLRPLARTSAGAFEEITSERALDEISARLRRLIADHGPRSVAMYNGTYATFHPEVEEMTAAFMRAIESPMRFHSATIDQPGRQIATAVHGSWHAGRHAFADSDVVVLLGTNPLVSMLGGIPPANPNRWLREAKARGLTLVVIDPRRTETAVQADLHLRPRPGTDAFLLAGMALVVIDEGLIDHEFLAANVDGVDALAEALAPFTPSAVEEETGVAEEDLRTIATLFARARRGYFRGGTGTNMAPFPTLTEYLILVLHSLCGQWRREGDPVTNLPVLTPPRDLVAEPRFRGPGWGFGERLRVRNLTNTAAGLPTAAAADEILLDGPGRVRALITVGGNPVAAWPDQERTIAAMKRLELAVTIDPRMTATGRLSHYVLPPLLGLESPAFTYQTDLVFAGGVGMGYPMPYARYSPAVCDPPAGSDLVPEWAVLFGIAQRLGVPLTFKRTDLDMRAAPSTDELLQLLADRARVPLAEVRAQAHGGTWPAESIVAPRRNDLRLQVGNDAMMSDLRELADRAVTHPAASIATSRYPFRLISRRVKHVYNSTGQDNAKLVKDQPFNVAFVSVDDLRDLGAAPGDLIEIQSPHSSVRAVCEADATLPNGVVSMAHGWGTAERSATDPRRGGTSTSRLVSLTAQYDKYSGIPLMSAIPVRIATSDDGDLPTVEAT